MKGFHARQLRTSIAIPKHLAAKTDRESNSVLNLQDGARYSRYHFFIHETNKYHQRINRAEQYW
jgi:hypothetical protein